MSRVSGQLTSRSNASGKQGKIHTENPELIKLLQENKESNRRSPRKKSSSPVKSPKKPANEKKGEAKEDSTEIQTNAKVNSKKDNSSVSNSSDVKVNLSGKDNKENKAKKSDEVKKDTHGLMNDGKTEPKSKGKGVENKVPVNHPPVKDDKHKKDTKTQKDNLPEKKAAAENTDTGETFNNRDLKEDLNEEFILSDINESDRETPGSSSSELARLKSPSRKSLNPDFEGGSLPSSPVIPDIPKAVAPNSREVKSQSENNDSKSSTPVSSNKTAGVTPHPSSFKPDSKTPTPEGESSKLLGPDTTLPNNSSSIVNKDPYNIKNLSVLRTPSANSEEKERKEETLKSAPISSPHHKTSPPAQEAVAAGSTTPTNTTSPINTQPAETKRTSPLTATSTNSPLPAHPKPNPTYSGLSPRQSKSTLKSPRTLADSLTLGPNQSVSSVNPSLLQTSIEDKNLKLEDRSHPRFTAPYSSQRLRARGEVAKRSASVATVNDSLETPRAQTEDKNQLADKDNKEEESKADIERDSLEIEKEEDYIGRSSEAEKPKGDIVQNNQKEDFNRQKEDEKFTKDSLDDNSFDRTDKTSDDPVGAESEINSNQNNSDPTDLKSEENQDSALVDKDSQGDNLIPKFDFGRERSNTKDTLVDEQIGALSVNREEQELPAPSSDLPDSLEQQKADEVEFVLKTDPRKQQPSRYSSAAPITDRSSGNLRRYSDTSQVGTFAVASANRTTPGSRKVYVESPTFTREEEDEYRFVSSRLDDVEEEKADTYRELDMAAIEGQETYAALAGSNIATGKRVRYSDVDPRYEDRDGGRRVNGMNQGGGYSNLSKANQEYVNENTGFPSAAYAAENPDIYSYNQRQNNRNPSYASGANNGYLGDGSDKENRGDRYPEDPRNRREYEQPQQHGIPPHLQQQQQQHPREQQQQHPREQQQQTFGNRYDSEGGGQRGYGYPEQLGYGNNPPRQGYANQGQGHFADPNSQSQHGYANQHAQPPNRQQLSGGLNPQQGPPPSVDYTHQQPPQQQQTGNTNKPPVKGLSLPTGPSYDPVDEEDLQRETTYQQGLKVRVEDGIKKAQEVNIPQIPIHPNQGHGFQGYDSRDFAQDSLDYETIDDTPRGFPGGFARDSLDMYHAQQPQNQFRNPPPLPQGLAGPSNHNPYYGGHLNNVDLDSEDFDDHGNVRQQRTNQVQPRFYNPQFDQNRGGHNNNSGYYESEPNTGRSDADLTFRQANRYEDANVEDEPMEAVHPKPPKYDYVSHNKDDYGRQKNKSYQKIHEVNMEEKERLNEIFIHPKPKQKGGILKKGKNQSRQGSLTSDLPPSGRYEEQDVDYDDDMSAAEQVWAQRSATLAKKFDNSKKKGKPQRGALQKYNSDSSLNQVSNQQRRQNFQPHPQQQIRTVPPDKKAFLTEMPTPEHDRGFQNNQIALPNSPRQGDIHLRPITQQIITEDGQRISVDVNLKLISPPPPMGGSPHHQQAYQHQQQHQPPEYYSGGPRGRQYPAVAHYDEDDGGRYEMAALDYTPQGYESSEYAYTSPQGRYSADEALRALNNSRTEVNPYGKIPPIPKSSDSNHPSSAPDQGGSYMQMYKRQREQGDEKPWYKVYGLRDYRKMQKEVRLGTLGPDLDSDVVKERREKTQRQQDYAKIVMEKNKTELAHRKPPSFPRHKEEHDILTKRKLAVEYAKNVPKPTVKPQVNEFNNYELASEKSPIAKHHRQTNESAMSGSQKMLSPSPSQARKQKEKEMDILDLEKLRQRYEEDKQNEALIRRNTNSGQTRAEKYY